MVVSSLCSWSFERQVLLRNNLFRRSKVALAEDVRVLVYEHVIGRRRSAVQVLVVGSIPCYAGRVLGVGVEQICVVTQLGCPLNAALGVLTETGSRGVPIGEGPRAEAAFAALIDDGLFDLLEDGRPITLLSLEVDTKCSWICLLYTSDAADDLLCVDLGGRRIIKK